MDGSGHTPKFWGPVLSSGQKFPNIVEGGENRWEPWNLEVLEKKKGASSLLLFLRIKALNCTLQQITTCPGCLPTSQLVPVCATDRLRPPQANQDQRRWMRHSESLESPGHWLTQTSSCSWGLQNTEPEDRRTPGPGGRGLTVSRSPRGNKGCFLILFNKAEEWQAAAERSSSILTEETPGPPPPQPSRRNTREKTEGGARRSVFGGKWDRWTPV